MSNPKSTARIAGHPLHGMIVPFPIAFYIGAFVADVAFAVLGQPFWAVMAFWLLAAGVLMSALAATLGFIDFLGSAQIRALRDAWWHMGTNALIALISITDLVLRFLRGPVPGSHDLIALTAIVAALLVVSGWLGGKLVYKHRVGVSD